MLKQSFCVHQEQLQGSGMLRALSIWAGVPVDKALEKPTQHLETSTQRPEQI